MLSSSQTSLFISSKDICTKKLHEGPLLTSFGNASCLAFCGFSTFCAETNMLPVKPLKEK